MAADKCETKNRGFVTTITNTGKKSNPTPEKQFRATGSEDSCCLRQLRRAPGGKTAFLRSSTRQRPRKRSGSCRPEKHINTTDGVRSISFYRRTQFKNFVIFHQTQERYIHVERQCTEILIKTHVKRATGQISTI